VCTQQVFRFIIFSGINGRRKESHKDFKEGDEATEDTGGDVGKPYQLRKHLLIFKERERERKRVGLLWECVLFIKCPLIKGIVCMYYVYDLN
jgi:hypothetical protein